MEDEKEIYAKFLSLAKTLMDHDFEKADALFIVMECNREDMVDPLLAYIKDNPDADRDDIEVWLYGEDGKGNHITIFDDEVEEED